MSTEPSSREKLLKSWARTERYLLDAVSNFRDENDLCAEELKDFHHYLDHNELGLALDALESAFNKAPKKNWRVMELMAMASANMGLTSRTSEYDKLLSEALGRKYQTTPSETP